ncbi:Msa family membrane protein [Staphylococcus pasteuri]
MCYFQFNINVYLASILTLLIPTIITGVFIFYCNKHYQFMITNSLFNLLCYILYSLYIMNLPNYDSYILNSKKTNDQFEISIDENMIAIPQLIFIFLFMTSVLFLLILIKKRRGFKC